MTRQLMTYGDTRRDRRVGIADMILERGLTIWASKPPANGFQVWAKPGWSSGWTWRWHVESSRSLSRGLEAKQSCEELVAVRCIDQKMDHFAPRVKWSQNI
jgi:hypothetical protein